jgi:FMN phosphatase YigB (HAD superfamily)
MTSIDTLFLDAGSVLVHPNWWRISDALGAHGLAVSPAALRDADPHMRFAIDTEATIAGTNDADRGSLFLHGVLDRAGVPRGVARDAALTELYAYHLTHNLWDHVPDDVPPALERLTGMGLRLVVASNANGVLARMFERVGLSGFFHTIGDSHVEGVEKPDPRFFEILLARCGGRPEATLHVGDLYHVDVAGARRAGIAALLFDPHGLYAGLDVERISRLGELPERLSARLAGGAAGPPRRDGEAGES